MTVIAQDDHLTAGAWAACGLEWNKCGRVTISAHFPKLKITLVSKLYLLEW